MKLDLNPRLLIFAGIIIPALFFFLNRICIADTVKVDLNTISFDDFVKLRLDTSQPRKEKSDLDKDGIIEDYILSNGRLEVRENSRRLWISPETWWIDDFCLADSTHDGIIDINLSLWKSGCFGSSKPFWIEENDWSVKNHFFILNLRGNRVRQVWCSSNLAYPNLKFTFSDLDNDGKQELVVLEGDYADFPDLKGKHLATWKWNGWGFFNEWRQHRGQTPRGLSP